MRRDYNYVPSAYVRLHRVYRSKGGKLQRIYCPEIALDDLTMSNDNKVNWSCSYCDNGAISPSVYLCPGCQAPRSKADMSCSVKLRGRLPRVAHLLGLGETDEIEVHGGDCGNPRIANSESLVMQLYQFEITRVNIPFMTAMSMQENSLVECMVEAQCRVKFNFDKMLEGMTSSDRRKCNE